MPSSAKDSSACRFPKSPRAKRMQVSGSHAKDGNRSGSQPVEKWRIILRSVEKSVKWLSGVWSKEDGADNVRKAEPTLRFKHLDVSERML